MKTNATLTVYFCALCFFLLSLFPGDIYSQSEILVIREDNSSQISEDCQNVKRDIKELLSKFIIRFQQASSLIDLNVPATSEMLVTAESQEKFTKMFAYSSRIYNDLMEYPTMVSPQDYAAYIAKNYKKGIPVDQLFITDVFLKSLNYNADAQIYEISLKINKLLYSATNIESGNEKKYKEGRLHPLNMQLNLSQNLDPKDLVIVSITGPIIVKPKPLTKWFNLDAIVGLNKPSITTNSWVIESANSNINVNPGLNAGFGFTYFHEVMRNKGHYLVFGALGMLHQFNVSAETLNSSFENKQLMEANIEGKHVIQYKNYKEANGMTIEALAGLSLSLKNDYRSNLGLGIYLKPYYLLSSDKTEGEIYILQQITGEDPWCSDILSGIGNEVNKTGLYLILSPFYEKEVNSDGTNRIRINLDINYSLTSWFKETTFSGFQYGELNPDLGDNTIIYSKFLPHYIGLRFEYMFKLNNK